MASVTPRPTSSDPLRSFKFNVIIPLAFQGGTPFGIDRFGFMSMSGLGISIEPLTYREGGDNTTTRKMPGQADFNPITLSRGLFASDNDNWLWMTNLFTAMYGGGVNPLTSSSAKQIDPQDFRTTMYLNVLQHPNTTPAATGNGTGPTYQSSYVDQNQIVAVSFKLYSAWIGSLAYSDMDAGGNAVAVEQMSINYEGFDMQWGSTSQGGNQVPANGWKLW
jgi:phage tail-like protein